jgi:hypothetical protein
VNVLMWLFSACMMKLNVYARNSVKKAVHLQTVQWKL